MEFYSLKAFTVPMLKQYLHVFNEQATVLTNCLEEIANTGTVVDLWQYTINANYRMINESMLGYKIMVKGKEKDEYVEAALQAVALESKRYTNPVLFFNIFHKIYLYLFGYGRLYEKVQEFLKKILEEKLYELEKRKENRSPLEKKPVKTLIDFLLKIHDEQPAFDEHRIRIESLNLIMTGSDSTATTIASLCLFLAMHPEIQDRVYEEIQEVFKGDSTEVQIEHCNQLKYIEQCIKETLRRFTIVPITFRHSATPIKLNDKQVIPANCKVAFVYDAVHQNPSIYPEPEKYDPDRFSPENYSKNAKHFMGFGVGHRSCIGMKYAMLSLKTQLVHLLRKYRFTTDMQMSDIVHINDMVARSKNGYLVKIWHRQNNHEI